MANIVFDMIQATGHLNPSFKLAKMLKQRGHQVAYTTSNKHKEAIELQGFDTHNVYQLDTKVFPIPSKKDRKGNLVSTFLHYVLPNSWNESIGRYIRRVAIFTMERNVMMERIKSVLALAPDLILVDSMAPLYRAILYYAHGVKVVRLQTMMSPTRVPGIPPLHSQLIPRASSWHTMQVKLSWFRNSVRRYFRRGWQRVIYLASDPHSLSEMIIKKSKLPKDQLDYQRTTSIGIKGLWEVSLVPRALDFPRKYQDYEMAGGYAVDLDRKEAPLSDELKRILSNNQQPLIYCSLGTVSTVHDPHVVRRLRKILSAFRNQPWTVLMSVGNEINITQLGSIPENVRVFATVPQLQVLKNADLMITHGGLNSVVECILHQVPMVVCPLNNKWDQNGNAARVMYHGLGLRSNLRWERTKTLTDKIDQILQAEVFKGRIARMKEYIIAGDQHHQVVDRIDQMLKDGQRLAA